MPGSARDRKQHKNTLQQWQARQREQATPGPIVTPLLNQGTAHIGGWYPPAWPGPTPPSAFEVPPAPLSPAYTRPDKSIQQVGQEIDRQLAHLPRRGEALTPAQEEALDLLRQIASDLAIHAHHSHLDEFIARLSELGAACGRAVAHALREAR